jgi:hypothetical protein
MGALHNYRFWKTIKSRTDRNRRLSHYTPENLKEWITLVLLWSQTLYAWRTKIKEYSFCLKQYVSHGVFIYNYYIPNQRASSFSAQEFFPDYAFHIRSLVDRDDSFSRQTFLCSMGERRTFVNFHLAKPK